jgi:histidyl-tRNA synthetase
MFKTKPKLAKQFETIDKERIPFAVLVAPDELKQGKIRVKAQVGKDEAGGGQGELVDRSDLVSYLKKLLVGQE